MERTKSIERIILITSLVTFSFTIFVWFGIDKFNTESTRLFVFLIFLINVFIYIIVISLRRNKLLIFIIFFTLLFYGILLFIFRDIRSYFPKPGLVGEEVIGFVNYFGYPLYFDLVLFFTIIFSPLMITILLKKSIDDK